MILRHTNLFQFLILQSLLLSHLLLTAQAQEQEDEEEYVRVLVGFHDVQQEKEYVRRQRMQPRTAGRPKSKINYTFKQTEALAMQVTLSELEEMKKDSRFSYIEDDVLVPVAGFSNPTNVTALVEETHRQLAEATNYGIELTQANRIISPDPDYQECAVYACVVDSGVFIDNADIPYSRGDGYVDGATFGDAVGQDWYYPRGTSHGTYVGGIMIAQGGNDRGVVGVIPQGPQRSNVCLRVAKVVPDGEGVAFVSSLLEASEWCAQEAGGKPLVINLSFALGFETAPEAAIYNRLYDQGALIVAAAGNAGGTELMYPASHDSVISVAAIDAGSRRTDFSQYNDKIELSAPGMDIQVLQAQTNEIKVTRGTSLASPFVAGLAARVWAAVPRCSNKQVRQALRDTARRLGSGVPNREYGYGLIQARDARDLLVNSGCNAKEPTSSPSMTPSASPSAVPSPLPSQNPSVSCLGYLESCNSLNVCCEGFRCARMTDSLDDSLVCRRDTFSQSRPRLGSTDEKVCRGGYGGGCA
ncbi:unnamed protein product [Cylindrotheca closterium]|uniref:subtilisin n=1 Tax=Cylindrotheca closterium TaxID=2856 RepID=A0AAD2JIV0_9STRA|nr:unnamed protein product [Cylindrotheca closterium]